MGQQVDRWELWATEAGELRWVDPERQQGTQPGPPYRCLGTYRVDRRRGVIGALPPGVVRGDPAPQRYGLGGPRWVYLDQHRVCVDCRRAFVVDAATQQRMYEVRQLWTDVVKRRCDRCARRVLDHRQAQKRLMEAHAAVERGDPDSQAELARATLAAAEQVGIEALRRGLAAARRDGVAEVETALEDAIAERQRPRSRLP